MDLSVSSCYQEDLLRLLAIRQLYNEAEADSHIDKDALVDVELLEGVYHEVVEETAIKYRDEINRYIEKEFNV